MGNVGVTLSLSDPAGRTMSEIFREYGFVEQSDSGIFKKGNIILIEVEPLIVPDEQYKTPTTPVPYPADYDHIAGKFEIDYYVVASRHWAKSGQPSLTVHPTGNFGKAVYGGRHRELQKVPPLPMRQVFKALQTDPPKDFVVSLEATHHSPTQFSTPMFFAEVGSSENQWMDEAVCRYLVDSILHGVGSADDVPISIGFGGGHYCPKFSVMERDLAFGHIAAKYSLTEITEDLIGQMIKRTLGVVDKAFIENSVKGYEKKKVEVALRNLEIEYEFV